MGDGRPEDEMDIGHSAAAGGDRHGLARPDPLGQLPLGKLGLDLRGDVHDVAALEVLANPEDLGIVEHWQDFRFQIDFRFEWH
jgi:hypothetical protein